MAKQFFAFLLLIAVASITLLVSSGSATAQDTSVTFIFHGDVTETRQTEIRQEYQSVVDWFDTSYNYRPPSFTIQIGADSNSLVSALRSAGHQIADGAKPCFWSGAYGYILVDGCEVPLPFARLHTFEATSQLGQHPAPIVEPGHFRQGPAWLHHGAEEYGESSYLVAQDDTTWDEQLTERMSIVGSFNLDLAPLELTSNFWGALENRSIGWLAIHFLVEAAGGNSYVEFYRQRANHARWEDAFEAAFKLTVDEFYEQFPGYSERLRQAQAEKETSSWLDRWWRAAGESGRTQQIEVDASGQFLAWYGVDVPLSWFFETYPNIGLVARWSAGDNRYLGAIREVTATHSVFSKIRRNSVIYVALGETRSSALELPTPVHNRIRLQAGGNFVPWLGADTATITEIAAGIGASEVLLISGSGRSEPNDTERGNGSQSANKGDLLWVVSPQSTRWIQSPIAPRPAVDVDGTIALLDNPEAAEIADTEFTIEVVEGTVVDRDIEVIRARFADGIAFFRERFDTPRLPFEVKLHGPEFSENLPCGTGGIVTHIYLWCRNWTITGLSNQPGSTEMLVHEYFHTLQHHWNADHSPSRTPSWLLEGAAFYSEGVYWYHRGFESAGEQQDIRVEASRGVPDSVDTLAENWPTQARLPIYHLAYLAVHWLVDNSGNPDSWIQFWQPWEGRDRWAVFEEAFGISIEDFYEEFESWRAENYPPNP